MFHNTCVKQPTGAESIAESPCLGWCLLHLRRPNQQKVGVSHYNYEYLSQMLAIHQCSRHMGLECGFYHCGDISAEPPAFRRRVFDSRPFSNNEQCVVEEHGATQRNAEHGAHHQEFIWLWHNNNNNNHHHYPGIQVQSIWVQRLCVNMADTCVL